VGVEKQSTPKGDIFHVTKGDGSKSEQFTGPLSAAIRAFTIAGGSTAADSPGGASAVADPAAAARLRELKDAQAEAESDIRRYEVRLARRQSKPQQVFRPGLADDDAWEQRRLDELRSDLTRIKAEQAKLIASGKVEEVEQTRPGTNFTKIPPKNVKKLSGIVAHYRGMAHGFTACVRDQVKHGLSEDHAKRRCAVVTDLGQGTTKWRKGGKGKVSEESIVEAMLTLAVQEALARCAVVEEQFGPVGLVQLAEGVVEGPALVRELSEAVGSDFVLLALAGHPLAEAVFGVAPVAEGFGSNSAVAAAHASMNPAQRKRARAAERAAGSPGTLRSDGKAPKPPGAKKTRTTSTSSSDASKHPRGQKGTSQGGKFVSKGSSGSTVKQVQQRVGATVDGQFGSQTQAKVRSFQQRHGLKVDGVVGRQTALALAGHFPKARQTKPGELSSADHTRLSKLPKRPTRPRSSAPVRSGGGRVVR
jgi:hypothetical protein